MRDRVSHVLVGHTHGFARVGGAAEVDLFGGGDGAEIDAGEA